SWVAFTVIQRTSTGGTYADFSTSTVKFPKGLSSCSWQGYLSSASGRTTIVTGAPFFARQAPISPPTPPGPRIACRMVGHYALEVRSASRRGSVLNYSISYE